MDDMFAIPIVEVLKGIKEVEGNGEPLEDYVLVVPTTPGERKYYIIKEKDLK